MSGYNCGGPGEPCNATNDKYYRPSANVSRGQLSKIIALAAGLIYVVPTGQQSFHDVLPGDTFYVYIEQLAQTGAIAGYPCNSTDPQNGEFLPCDSARRPWFRPNNLATRGQISKIVSIAAGFNDNIPASRQTFSDVPQSSPFWVYIERLAERNIISGYDAASGRCSANNPPYAAPCFLYNDFTTRGQMAKIASNAFFPNCQTPVNIYGVTVSNRLVSFNSNTPGLMLSNVAITGMQAGENMLGMDFRPANGGLYGLGSTSRIYTINTSTGAATLVGTGAFTATLSGTDFGFDFNPTVDRIRVVSDADQNLRLNPDTGQVAAVDGNLAYSATDPNTSRNPNAVGAAYTNNFAGSTSTTLFDIDSDLDTLVTQNPPNAGPLNTVRALGVNTGPNVGFDVQGGSTVGYASLSPTSGGQSSLYTVGLTTTDTTVLLGPIGVNEQIRDIAVK